MTRTPDGRGRERRTDTILPSVLSAREHGCPPPRPDRLPPRRGGRPSPTHTVNAAMPADGSFARLPVSRGAGSSAPARSLAPRRCSLLSRPALPTAQAQEADEVLLSNLGQTTPTTLTVGGGQHSQGFTTGSNTDGYVLSSIELDVAKYPEHVVRRDCRAVVSNDWHYAGTQRLDRHADPFQRHVGHRRQHLQRPPDRHVSGSRHNVLRVCVLQRGQPSERHVRTQRRPPPTPVARRIGASASFIPAQPRTWVENRLVTTGPERD